ncbi:stomatin-like protein 1 isoform X3 [Hydra vulgaris]|uniref:Stomatin-like protein 1 isoform X3 n=1 Tax=Hydra vulgaris TaxID=6087 RepID=A0ABM4BSX8_HYDVU
MLKLTKYSNLTSVDNPHIDFYDDFDRKEKLGDPSFNVFDYFVMVIVYIIWIISLPVTCWCSFKVVPQHERAVVSRLGRLIPLKGPGIICVIPFVDNWKKVDIRTKIFSVPPIEVISTERNIFKVGANVQYKIVDPVAMYTLVQDVDNSLQMSGHTVLSTQLSGQSSSIIQNEKFHIETKLLNQMNKSVGHWGVEISKFELTSLVLKDSDHLKIDEDNETGISAIINVFKSLTSSGTFGSATPVFASSLKQKPNENSTPNEIFFSIKRVISEQLCQQINAIYEFSISDTPENNIWILDLKNSPGCIINKPNQFIDIDVRFEMNTYVLQSIFHGLISPTEAYKNGSLKINGNIQTALKLNNLIPQLHCKL